MAPVEQVFTFTRSITPRMHLKQKLGGVPPLAFADVHHYAHHAEVPSPQLYKLASSARANRAHNDVLFSRSYRAMNEMTTLNFQQRHMSSQSGSSGDAAAGGHDTTQIPDMSHYKKSSSSNEDKSRAFSYAMIGATGALGAIAGKTATMDLLTSMSASADVLALAKVEVDLSAIPEGKNVILKWRGKPIFIRHRTEAEIQEANTVDLGTLRDPETDAQRTKRPEWLVMLGVCTHLGCVPVGDAGDFGGWFCPCHGSHYDIAGRIRKGPAPLNLEVPPYEFLSDDKLIIG